ncbi:glycosyltransferase family 4 protein [Methylobacterium goesingense]|uniref:UDP-glucose:(Heptosyl)LPS alpha-1,3-glucosyltransferase n=1 Tax=Methylobacterium goesingense TaxID=243690 RepID=A0ABV2KZ05_9HYPH|nr:glycosyltransferase family 4 protein [Methylobacterium goesingense]GJD76711.1 D-inositol-3-phosphate glycosyltransferase [Methylobacterium goesingense]
MTTHPSVRPHAISKWDGPRSALALTAATASAVGLPFEIVQVVQELSAAGGAETVAFELARTFARMGAPNRVIATRVDGAVDAGTRVERVLPWLSGIVTRGALRYLGRAIVVPAFTLAATVALRRHRSALVISHGDSLAGDILVVHAINAVNLQQKRRNGEWRWLLNPLHLWVALRERWMIGGLRYARYVAISERVRQDLRACYGVPDERIRRIPNGIDLDRFRNDFVAGPAIRAEFGIPAEARVLLFVGHEFGRKGLAHVIGALCRLGPDYRLLVVGSDNPAPYRDSAGARAGDVIFAGPRADMPAFYAAADALVLPSSYETFSLVCMEAMACGVPILATAVGGIEEYLVEGTNGYFVKPEAADIAAAVTRALSDPDHVAALRAGARATAEGYAWDSIGRQYLALAREIVIARTGTPLSTPADAPGLVRKNDA